MNATEEKVTAQKPPTVLGAYFARLRDPSTRKRALVSTGVVAVIACGTAAAIYHRGYKRGRASAEMSAWSGGEGDE